MCALPARRIAYVSRPATPMVASATPSMTSEPAAQPRNARDWPATSSATGNISASCGLIAISESTSPAASGRLCRKSHQEIDTAAATTITTWPSIRPKATEGTATANARCPSRTNRLDGGTVSHQVTSSAADNRTFQSAYPIANGSAANGATNQASGGG